MKRRNTSDKYRLIILLIFILFYAFASAQPMRVMCFNIRVDLAQDGHDRWLNRKQELGHLIKTSKPEILGIQEGLSHQVEYLDSVLTNFEWIGVGRDDGKRAGEFTAIFYDTLKYRLLENNTFWLAENTEVPGLGWDAAYKRTCTYGLFESKTNGNKLYVFNTHFDNRGILARLKSAELLMAKIASIKKNGHPIIVMGDLNSLPESEPLKVLMEELNDALTISETSLVGPKGTFTGFSTKNSSTQRIDYIFVHGFQVRSYQHMNEMRKNGQRISDHLPVFVTLNN